MSRLCRYALVILAVVTVCLHSQKADAQERLAKFNTENATVIFFGNNKHFTLAITPRGHSLRRKAAIQAQISSLDEQGRLLISLPGYPNSGSFVQNITNDYFTSISTEKDESQTLLVLKTQGNISVSEESTFDPRLKTLFIDLQVSNLLPAHTSSDTPTSLLQAKEEKPAIDYKRASLTEKQEQPNKAPLTQSSLKIDRPEPSEKLSKILSHPPTSLVELSKNATRLGSLNSKSLQAALWSYNATYVFSVTAKEKSFNVATINPEIIVLNNPPRLVVDIPGYPSETNKKLKLSTSTLKGIRQGAHREKTRYVIDLAKDSDPTYSISKDEKLNTLFVSFLDKSLSDDGINEPAIPADTDELISRIEQGIYKAASQPLESEANNDLEVNTKEDNALAVGRRIAGDFVVDSAGVIKSNPAKFVPVAPSQSISLEKTVGASSAEDIAKAITPGKLNKQTPKVEGQAELKKISFKNSDSRELSAVVIDIHGLKLFTLIEKEIGKYHLTLKDTIMQEALSKPVSIPKTVKGYKSITPFKLSGNVVIEINVDEYVQLVATRTRNKLWITANYAVPITNFGSGM